MLPIFLFLTQLTPTYENVQSRKKYSKEELRDFAATNLGRHRDTNVYSNIDEIIANRVCDAVSGLHFDRLNNDILRCEAIEEYIESITEILQHHSFEDDEKKIESLVNEMLIKIEEIDFTDLLSLCDYKYGIDDILGRVYSILENKVRLQLRKDAFYNVKSILESACFIQPKIIEEFANFEVDMVMDKVNYTLQDCLKYTIKRDLQNENASKTLKLLKEECSHEMTGEKEEYK